LGANYLNSVRYLEARKAEAEAARAKLTVAVKMLEGAV